MNGSLIIMAVAITIGISDQGRQILARWQDSPRRIVEALDAGMTQVLNEAVAHVQTTQFGKDNAVKNRTGALSQSLHHGRTSPLSGFVGTREGPTSSYARTILGAGQTTIKPKTAKHLWIPIADNLNPSGLMKMSPREAMSLTTPDGKRLLRIFTSKAGNTVAFLPEAREASSLATKQQGAVPTGAKFSRGPRKGLSKGRLLFVLKDSVTIEGTDALAKGITSMGDRARQILESAITEALK